MADPINSPAEYIKRQGLPSQKVVQEISGVSRECLWHWFRKKELLFMTVVEGAKVIYLRQQKAEKKRAKK